jgi:hypothetical protein
MTLFVIGIIIGVCFTFLILGLCNVSGRSDLEMEILLLKQQLMDK